MKLNRHLETRKHIYIYTIRSEKEREIEGNYSLTYLVYITLYYMNYITYSYAIKSLVFRLDLYHTLEIFYDYIYE